MWHDRKFDVHGEQSLSESEAVLHEYCAGCWYYDFISENTEVIDLAHVGECTALPPTQGARYLRAGGIGKSVARIVDGVLVEEPLRPDEDTLETYVRSYGTCRHWRDFRPGRDAIRDMGAQED